VFVFFLLELLYSGFGVDVLWILYFLDEGVMKSMIFLVLFFLGFSISILFFHFFNSIYTRVAF